MALEMAFFSKDLMYIGLRAESIPCYIMNVRKNSFKSFFFQMKKFYCRGATTPLQQYIRYK